MTEPSERLTGNWDVEALLSDALRPIEPPERLSSRVEDTLAAVTQAAAEELSDWADELSEAELRALRDPRNWVRPVVVVVAAFVAALLQVPSAGAASGNTIQGRVTAKATRTTNM